jgi:hypothetical protein
LGVLAFDAHFPSQSEDYFVLLFVHEVCFGSSFREEKCLKFGDVLSGFGDEFLTDFGQFLLLSAEEY